VSSQSDSGSIGVMDWLQLWVTLGHGILLVFTSSAQIVVGSIVAKAPNSPLAQPALEQTNAAFVLFDRAAQQQPESMGRPAKALVC
jgi:hypothetical protein